MSQTLVIIAILIGAVVCTPAQPHVQLGSYHPTFSAADSSESDSAQIGVSSKPGSQSVSSRFLLPSITPLFRPYGGGGRVITSYIPGSTDYSAQITSFDNFQNVPGMPSSYPGIPSSYPGIPSSYPGIPPYIPSMPSNIPSMPSNFPSIPSNFPNMPSYIPSMPSNNPSMQGQAVSVTQFGPSSPFDSYQQTSGQANIISGSAYPPAVADYNTFPDPYDPYPHADEVFSKQPNGASFSQYSQTLPGGMVVQKQTEFPKTPAYYLARSVNALGDLGSSVSNMFGMNALG